MPDSDSTPARSSRIRALLTLVLALVIGAAVLVALTLWVIGSPPRSQAVALLDDMSLDEFAVLPDEDAYPAALAIAADGRVFTGSYQTGALWEISPAGQVREIAGARHLIGSVTGLDVAPDGQLHILDRLAALESQGAKVWRYSQGALSLVLSIADRALLPDDIAVDKAGRITISDRRGHVLRYDAAGQPLGADGDGRWWSLPCADGCEATGLAYDAATDSLLVADAAGDRLYRIELADDASARVQTLFQADEADGAFGMDGVAAAASGEIYLALLATNQVARLDDGQLLMLARDFRGASDLVMDESRDRLIIANWNQFSLGFGTRPQLPFALDALSLP